MHEPYDLLRRSKAVQYRELCMTTNTLPQMGRSLMLVSLEVWVDDSTMSSRPTVNR